LSTLASVSVHANTHPQNAPFSAVVCGVQGSGKSHTVSVLLENMLVEHEPRIGHLVKPFAGLVLHLGEGGPAAKACEAAWLGVPSHLAESQLEGSKPNFETKAKVPRVLVFVSPSSIETMRGVYAKISEKIEVQPLYFSEAELDAESFKAMMGISLTEANPPLYVQIILVSLTSSHLMTRIIIDRMM
jgi:hypothetical protein